LGGAGCVNVKIVKAENSEPNKFFPGKIYETRRCRSQKLYDLKIKMDASGDLFLCRPLNGKGKNILLFVFSAPRA
jgi:hypothetical protein